MEEKEFKISGENPSEEIEFQKKCKAFIDGIKESTGDKRAIIMVTVEDLGNNEADCQVALMGRGSLISNGLVVLLTDEENQKYNTRCC